MAHPPVVIVDSNDKEVGEMPLKQAWQTGAYHRIVRILVEDRDGRILLQRRALGMELYPGCWDVSAAGHVDAGMTYESAARLELVEELGLADGELEEIGYYQSSDTYKGRRLNRFNKLYRMCWSHTPELFAREEVSEVRWFTQAEIVDMVAKNPDSVSDGLQQLVDHAFIGAAAAVQ